MIARKSPTETITGRYSSIIKFFSEI